MKDLLSNFGKTFSDLFVSLEDSDILRDGFKKVLAEIFDLVCINDIFSQKVLGLLNQNSIPIFMRLS